jgi:hypothetical protein
MKHRRISNSPLLDPAVCALLLISPDAHEPASTDPCLHAGHQRALASVTKAADLANVPVFVLSRRARQQKPPLSSPDPGTASHRHFAFEEHSSPWSHNALIEALAAEDRSVLVLGGFWLEHEILATALHALVDSYDVYVLLDATLPRSPLASGPARERLNQAGATPVITSQVINEWSLETPDASTRAALVSLLPPLIELE